MAKLSKKEMEKLQKQHAQKADRGPTFVGVRPTVFADKKHPNSKRRRAEGKKACRGW